MARTTDCRLTANGHGAQMYLGRDLLNDSASPLEQDQQATATIVDGVGMLLAPRDDDREIETAVDASTSPPTVTITLSPPGGDA